MAGFRTETGEVAVQPIDDEVEALVLEQLQETDRDVIYLKARHLAEDLDATPAAIGKAFHRLRLVSTRVDVDAWSGAASNGTTWEVRRA